MTDNYVVIPIELKELNWMVRSKHRHHKPVVGHRFSLGLVEQKTGKLVGAICCGRPVARMSCDRRVLEVTRLVTDGTPNACSQLYSAAARAGKAMGFERIRTYILDSETGASLKASSWTLDPEEKQTSGGNWNGRGGRKRREDQPMVKKARWTRELNAPFPDPLVEEVKNNPAIPLFEGVEVNLNINAERQGG